MKHKESNYEKCRRCAESGADHYVDENGNLVYLCEKCRYGGSDTE